jgi:hypothetical protein
MGSFADKNKISNALALMASTLPVVKFNDQKFRIRKITEAEYSNELATAVANSERLMPYGLGSSDFPVGAMVKMASAVPCLAGQMLVDDDGQPVLKDVHDFRAFAEFAKTEDGQRVLEVIADKSGLEEITNNRKKAVQKVVETPTDEQIEEAVTGNSEPSSVTE